MTRVRRSVSILFARVGPLVAVQLAMPAAFAAAFPPIDELAAGVNVQRLSSARTMGIVPLIPSRSASVGTVCVFQFRVGESAPFDRVVPVAVADPDVAEVVGAANVLTGRTLGCVVVRPLKVGETTVTIGEVPVGLRVVSTGDPAAPARVRISSPADGAGVWGTIAVGVTWWRPGLDEDALPELAVRGFSTPFKPMWTNTIKQGPLGVAVFEINTSSIAEGSCTFSATIAVGASVAHHEVDHVELQILRPESSQLLSGECEAAYDLPELPENRRERKPKFGEDKHASGEKYFDNSGSNPHFRFPVEVPEGRPGWYQVMLTGEGDIACGALPSVGIVINEAERPITRSAIASPEWHRTPIGTPIRLEPGKHVVRFDYLNDFYAAGGADRNLRLDKVEIARVGDVGGSNIAGTASSGEMSMSPMSSVSSVSSVSAMTTAPEASSPMMMSGAAMTGGTMSGETMGMMGSGAGTMSAGTPSQGLAWPESSRLRSQPGFRLSFARPLDGCEIAGDLEVRAAAWWPGMNDAAAYRRTPRVTLMLNDVPVGSQLSVAPRFTIPWSMFKPGDNTLALVGRGPGGLEARTPVQHVLRPGLSDSTTGTAGSLFERFTVREPGWDDASGAFITSEQNPSEKLCFGLFAASSIILRLPDELAGTFELDIEAKGQHFDGPPIVEATLLHGALDAAACGTEEPLGALRVPTGWDSHTLRTDEQGKTAAKLMLERGHKFLKLAFINDKYEVGADGKPNDRNVFIQGVAFRRTAVDPGSPAPLVASLLYPKQGAVIRSGGADAVIVRVSGSASPATAQVFLNGKPHGLALDLRRRPGPYLLPISMRGAPLPGEHSITIRVTDSAGRSSESEPRTVRATSSTSSDGQSLALEVLTDYERAVIMLDRFAYGADERELASALLLGTDAYLRDRLAQAADSPGVETAREIGEVRYPDSRSAGDVPRRAIMQAIVTPNPVRTRFVLWAENHFSTWMRKAEPRRKADEHARFDALGIADFSDLLLASAKSPAMLIYLDQSQSFARKINENYAREIMELHTLGVNGGYTQDDVTALAKLLTGWTLAREPAAALTDELMEASSDDYGMAESFRYDPLLGDEKPANFLGHRFSTTSPEDRYTRTLAALEILASHPSTAQYIGRKIAEHYLGFPARDDVVESLASAFTRTGGDMGEVLLELAHHPAFYTVLPGTRAAHPPEFAFRLSRSARAADANTIHDYLNLSGHGMFDRSTPDGYQESDDEVMDSNAMLQRWKFAKRLEQPLLEMVPAELRSGDKPIADDDVQSIIDLISTRLTGRLLGEASNTAAVELFAKTSGKRDERARVLTVFIACTPEVQLK